MRFPDRSEVEAGLDAYNRFLAGVWSSKQDEFAARLAKAAQKLVEEEERVREIDKLEIDLASPPRLGFDGALDEPGRLRVLFRLPGSESWSFRIRARIVVGWPFSRRGNLIEVAVKRLQVTAEAELDRSSPVAASFVSSQVQVKLGDVNIDASNFLLKIFSRLLSFFFDVLDRVVERLAREALAGSLPDADAVRAIEALGLAAEPVTFPGPPPDLASLEERARGVSARVADRHMPFGSVLNTLVSRDDPEGEAQGYIQFEDSAIWTGHLLAGELFRHQVTGEAAALESVRRALDGVASLARLTEVSGLLSRVRVPLSEEAVVAALDEERRRAGHEDRLFTSADGEYRSIGHITRDQYAGAFLGTALAAVHLDDGELREKAREVVLEMASYLVEQHFCPTEATVDPVTGTRLASVTYVANPGQVLAILQAARKLDPERFGAAFEALFPVWSIQWLFAWLQTLDPVGSYYKFNLEHSAAFLLLLLEDDADRRTQLTHGLRAIRGPLRYHAQAYFNLVELATLGDEELSRPRPEIEEETRQLLGQAFERPLFITKSDLGDDPAVEKVVFRGLSGEEEERIAARVVDVPRRPGTDFLWQRTPFALEVVWTVPEDPAMRSPNVDLVLPYWLARKLGL